MIDKKIALGWNIPRGDQVFIPAAHLCVVGQTQQSGKTTALEALIERSKARAVTFVTKRGEGSFSTGRRMPPFFKERADWPFVSSLIDATMGEKNRLIRSWLMRVCRDTTTLAEVQRNVEREKAKARGFNESIYTEIAGYLELVVPQLALLPPATTVDIRDGLNVIDLTEYRHELQGLVIRSVLEHVYEHEKEVITVIPEAWEFLPEGRGSPVKLAAETLIRKGAANRNFLWIDSQDLGGVWKNVLRSCSVVLIGVQREANEIKRTLANIPAGVPTLKPRDVATLELGQFYACFGREAIKTYVQPVWMGEIVARRIAMGTAKLEDHSRKDRTIVTDEQATKLAADNATLRTENEDLRRRIRALEKKETPAVRREPVPESVAPAVGSAVDGAVPSPRAMDLPDGFDAERLYHAFKARLVAEAPGVLKVLTDVPVLEILVHRRVLEATDDTLRGRIGVLIKAGFFDEPRAGTAIESELRRQAFGCSRPNCYREADKLATDGFLRKMDDGYQVVPGMKIHVVEA